MENSTNTQETDKSSVADTKSEKQEINIGKKIDTLPNQKLLLTSALLGFLFIALTTAFVLIGYIPSPQGGCLYQGPFSSVTHCTISEQANFQEENDTELPILPPVEAETKKEYEGYVWYTDRSEYEFVYPTDWHIKPLEDDQEFLLIYSRDPSIPSGQINENMSIVPITLMSPIIDDATCKNLADNVIADVASVFESITLENYAAIQINGKDACRITVTSVLNGLTVTQVQHIFVNKQKPSTSYVLTATQTDNTPYSQEFFNIIESFTIL